MVEWSEGHQFPPYNLQFLTWIYFVLFLDVLMVQNVELL